MQADERRTGSEKKHRAEKRRVAADDARVFADFHAAMDRS
jgi:hypothetical protein